jgi:L,D-peptidoglycan transpeptidase YkuD (ErfK/YbiS/YcfS/YnhG family)
MLINLKNKDTLEFDEFKFKCSIGKNGLKKNKIEGDKCTPIGLFDLGLLYYRQDRVPKPQTLLETKVIKKDTTWCDDPSSKFYNKEIKINKFINHEKFYRKDHIYDIILVVKYNYKQVVSGLGSAIFIHLTKDYKPTAGCIALKKKDFLILLKVLNKKNKLKVF